MEGSKTAFVVGADGSADRSVVKARGILLGEVDEASFTLVEREQAEGCPGHSRRPPRNA
jgi:hypothetical protein